MIISNTAWGTGHRNHCPLCLWSRHVDLKTPGDRRSDCGCKMQPFGLSQKSNGELMVVHLCLGCKKISHNRIAGDDNPDVLLSLLGKSCSFQGIMLLTLEDKGEVLTAIFGSNCQE